MLFAPRFHKKEYQMSNPLLTFTELPPFSEILPEHVKPAIEHCISECRNTIEQVLADNPTPTWTNDFLISTCTYELHTTRLTVLRHCGVHSGKA